MRGLSLALLILVAGCANPEPFFVPPPVPEQPVVNQHPGTATWKLEDGTFAIFSYSEFRGSGTYDPSNGMIVPPPVEFRQNGRQTNLLYHMPNDPTQIAVARVQSQADTKVTAVDPKLNYTLIERRRGNLIGEVANQFVAEMDPPEPYLSDPPVVGYEKIVSSALTGWDGSPGTYLTEFWVNGVDVTFDGFEHATVTALTENPGHAGSGMTAYVWVFSDGEIAEEIIAQVNADNTVTIGSISKRIAVGRN